MNFWQGNIIRLRAVEPTDAEIFFRWNQDSQRAMFLDFLWPPTSLEDTRLFTEAQSKKKLEEDSYMFLIETLEKVPVGSISTHHCNPHSGSFSYGIDICEEHRRHGYATQAILLVLRYYFDHLRYQKVTAAVHADNLASQGLHKKIGFLHEGTLRRMCYQDGVYIDEHYYGMTIEEFHQHYSPALLERNVEDKFSTSKKRI